MKQMVMMHLVGFIPLGVGLIMNGIILQDTMLPLTIIGIAFLMFWIFIGYKTHELEETPLLSSISIHLPAAFALIFVLFQEIVLGQYMNNIFGLLSQLFFLPLIRISSFFTFWTMGIWPIYIVSFLLMIWTYYLGIKLKAVKTSRMAKNHKSNKNNKSNKSNKSNKTNKKKKGKKRTRK